MGNLGRLWQEWHPVQNVWVVCWVFLCSSVWLLQAANGCTMRGESSSNQPEAIKNPELASTFSGPGSHGLSWTQGRKTVVVMSQTDRLLLQI